MSSLTGASGGLVLAVVKSRKRIVAAEDLRRFAVIQAPILTPAGNKLRIDDRRIDLYVEGEHCRLVRINSSIERIASRRATQKSLVTARI